MWGNADNRRCLTPSSSCAAHAGQNIARGQVTPEEVFYDWFNEVPPNDGHRRNILTADFTQMGLGWTQSTNMWTQNFGGLTSESCV